MSNKWCYEHFISKTKPKNIFKRLCYKIWLMCGVSPSGLYLYNSGHYLKGGKSMIEETKLYAGDEVVEKIKTIKIIDLWNKIAKAYLGSNEYIPKRIKYRMYDEEHSTFTYDEEEYEYYNGKEFLSVPNHHLNDTVEIIEEDNNKIEKLERLYILQANESAMPDTLQDINNKAIMNKIDEIIDHINNL